MNSTDYGRDEFQEIGKLSSMLPAYVRACCRATFDGTDESVLESYRQAAYKVLRTHDVRYEFVKPHIELLLNYSPRDMWSLIALVKLDSGDCLASNSALGMPKRACLHCHYVGKYVALMKKAGKEDEKTGFRYQKNGVLRRVKERKTEE